MDIKYSTYPLTWFYALQALLFARIPREHTIDFYQREEVKSRRVCTAPLCWHPKMPEILPKQIRIETTLKFHAASPEFLDSGAGRNHAAAAPRVSPQKNL
jgi:hypothetical protein